MKKITLNYEQAVDRLQTIVDALDNGKLELDQLSAHLKEAQDLLKYCKKRLQQTEKDVQIILQDGEE
ncbi:exodeoxyribonuclease VII small subunit [Alloprevotella tannerae]|jgi:exonuclease VII small subunit|uniref:exodeoxyribonuclease VII small subunit n=1 Tax=Alloprevotella tannerae TaxID=76122 RepID=UPI0028E7BDA2|nr:exodeoxyribonuclease VII small subunit [Alloprevotella tannerae]